jgi:hypothetical protein
LSVQFKRRNSEKTKWEEAKAVAALLEAADSWDGRPTIHPSALAAEVETVRMTIADAIAVFDGAIPRTSPMDFAPLVDHRKL